MSKLISEESEWEIGTMEVILSKNLNISVSELPICQFSIASWFVGNRYTHLVLDSVGNTIDWFSNISPGVENIQKIDDDHIAVIYKVVQENCDEAYMLMIFKRKIDEKSGIGSWAKTGEAYFVNEIHGIEDYKSIDVGDSVEKLYIIDESIHYDVMRKETSSNVIENNQNDPSTGLNAKDTPKMIYKLLSGGLLTIEYDSQDLTISEKAFYPYTGEKIHKYVNVIDSFILDCFIKEP